MRPHVKNLAPAAADTDSIATAQTLGGAGYLTLTASPVTFTNAQQCSLTVAVANLSGVNFTFVGTDADGHQLTETIAGPNNNTVTTTGYFLTVSSVYASAAVGTNVLAGNTGLAVSGTLVNDYVNSVQNIGVFWDVTGTMTFKMQYTFDDVFDLNYAKVWIDDATITGKSADISTVINTPIRGIRTVLTAFTSGTIRTTMVQGLEK